MASLLPDINVWLALSFEAHAHHRKAVAWFDGLRDGFGLFCRHTQQGFLRIASNPAAFGTDALSMEDARNCYETLRGDPRVGFIEEPLNLEELWRGYTEGGRFSRRIWSDAYLAALAVGMDLTLVSFDGGFAS
jgi:uncharacterized protein